MTDAEIIKTLNVCQSRYSGYYCERCPLFGEHDCVRTLIKESLAIIQRQQERMDKVVEQLEAEKYRGMEGLEPIKVAFNFGINKALAIVKGVQNER